MNVHFTVSPEHRALFKALVDEKAAAYAKKYGVDYNITFSEQKPSTDTIAADMETNRSVTMANFCSVRAVMVH